MKKLAGIAVLAALALGATAAALGATRSPAQANAREPISCKKPLQIGMMAPITGPAASIGDDQLHWAQFFVNTWNKNKRHKLKLKLIQGDTQLDPSKASVVAQQFASSKNIVGVIGPAGSQEVIASSPILKRAGLAFISGSATRVSLTDGSLAGSFFRVVPNDGVQGPTDADYMLTSLGVKSGSTVMIIDDQEAYSTGLADIVQQALTAKGVKVDRESTSQQTTDFSAILAKAGSAKVIFVPFQLSSQAQLVAQQAKSQGKGAIVFGSDGTFDSAKFTVEGSYVSFFAPDVTTVAADAAIVNAFYAAFGKSTTPFGAPNYVAAQAYAVALQKACKDGKTSRAEVRGLIAKTNLSSTILGVPLSFTTNGDVSGAKFHIFKIESGGKYVTVA
jgi:branched-chain amino acid transport system substrate-binding protein